MLGILVLISVLVEWVVRDPKELLLALVAGLGVSGLVLWVPASLRRSQIRRALKAMSIGARQLKVRLYYSRLRVEDAERRVIERPWSEATAVVHHADGFVVYFGLQTLVLPRYAIVDVEGVACFLSRAVLDRYDPRPRVLDWEMLANLGIWVAAALAGAMYCLD